MTRINMDLFVKELKDLLNTLYDKEHDNIKKAADVCTEAIKNDGVVHVFGSGHSIGFGMEMKNRLGDLVPIHQIVTEDFVLKGQVSLAEFKDPNNIFERRPGVAERLFNLYDIRDNDAFIIISNSGINGVVIDMAIAAKEKGHKVIVITSWQHTTAEPSRHPSGKKLYELADVVVDNCGPQGDALIPTEKNEKICSVSSITGAFIAQTIKTITVDNLIADGIEPPILWDEDLDGGKEHNEKLLERYAGRI